MPPNAPNFKEKIKKEGKEYGTPVPSTTPTIIFIVIGMCKICEYGMIFEKGKKKKEYLLFVLLMV